jgi:hypothetical protein
MADVIYSNVRDLNKRLDTVEAGLKRELQKEAKNAAKPLQTAIVNAIPTSAPRRGMNHNGRTSWNNSVNYKGQRVPAKSVTIGFRSGGSKRATVTSLVRVVANSPAVAIVDTAQRGRTPQGLVFVRGLGGSPSRYVWPAAMRALPAVQTEVRIVLDKYAAIASRRLF